MKIFDSWVGLPIKPLIQTKFLNAMGGPVDTDLPNHLKTINAHVNHAIHYKRDVTDQWATPQETLAKGYGDCEDIVLLKRAMLMAKGWRSDQLVMLLAKDIALREDHAVLLVLDGKQIWMLDNVHDSIVDALKPNNYLLPIIGLSEAASWMFGQRKTL